MAKVEAKARNGRPAPPPFRQRFGTLSFWNLDGKTASAPLIDAGEPTVHGVGPATLTPRRYSPKTVNGRRVAVRTIEGGIYDGNGRLLPSFAEREAFDEASAAGNRLRNDAQWNPESHPVQRRLEGSYAYMGLMRGHFGHFLLESLCRLWYLLRPDPGVRLLFHGEHPLEKQPSFVRYVFDLLEIDPERIVVVDEVASIEHLLMPDSLFEIRWKARTAQSAAFSELFHRNLRRNGPLATPERLYLTRRQLDVSSPSAAAKRVANEARVERLFARRGFTVVAPEKLPFPQQVAMAGQAREIAGLKGSALHMSLFNQRDDARLIQIDKRQSANQSLIDGLKGMEAHHVICKRPQPEGGFVVDTDPLRRALKKM